MWDGKPQKFYGAIPISASFETSEFRFGLQLGFGE